MKRLIAAWVIVLCTAWSPLLDAEPLLRRFNSDKELIAFLKPLMARSYAGSGSSSDLEQIVVTAQLAASITNNQSAGVDEGDIVKLHGDHLVILRRGRLFTVSIRNHGLRPIASVNAFAPGIDASGDWYDEMLVSDDKVVVIGYSYSRGGTEIGVFDIDARGALKFRSTYHLRSNDYYSSRNYASRLIGTKLVFYSALGLEGDANDPLSALPAMRKWHEDAYDDEFKRIATARRVYRPTLPLDSNDIALHTVTTCDLAKRELHCAATSVFGPYGRVFYASANAFYVWLSGWHGADDRVNSVVYRLPLDGSEPEALRVTGSPIDQFSFLEGEDGFLNVMVVSDGQGDGMWSAEFAAGDTALLRFPLSRFAAGGRVPNQFYRPLPRLVDAPIHNRFVGDYLLIGTGDSWGESEAAESQLMIVPLRGGELTQIEPGHSVDRIEVMGADAVVVGTDSEKTLHFSGIRLTGVPAVAQHYEIEQASEGEERSHGFFYRQVDAVNGVLGLPVSLPGRAGYQQLFDTSTAVVFLRNDKHRFQELGNLKAFDAGAEADACIASCLDWYGNSRPIFIADRIFALMGYEIVEGVIGNGRLNEVLRANFAPRLAKDEEENDDDE